LDRTSETVLRKMTPAVEIGAVLSRAVGWIWVDLVQSI
jgi:hypothetical protein